MATTNDDELDAQDDIRNLAEALALAVEFADYFVDEPPAGKAGKALAKELRSLLAPMRSALVRLQEVDPATVRNALAELQSPLLCVCARS
jgi:hypothetical protein